MTSEVQRAVINAIVRKRMKISRLKDSLNTHGFILSRFKLDPDDYKKRMVEKKREIRLKIVVIEKEIEECIAYLGYGKEMS